MVAANEQQVGGTHYKSAYQHWDLIEKFNVGYLPAQVTKYLTRWKKKNGLQDLEKAEHFFDKFLEREVAAHKAYVEDLERFLKENEVGVAESTVFWLLFSYLSGSLPVLYRIKTALDFLVKNEQDRQFEEAEKAEDDIEDLFSNLPDLNPNEIRP